MFELMNAYNLDPVTVLTDFEFSGRLMDFNANIVRDA